MRKYLNFYLFIAWNSMIGTNKWRQEHNNLATILRAKLRGAHEVSKSLQFIQFQSTNANPNRNGHGSLWGLIFYDNNGWICEVNETNTYIVKFCQTFMPIFFGTSKSLDTIENNISPLCILCMLIPQIIPLLTFTLAPTWYEESLPPIGGKEGWGMTQRPSCSFITSDG